MERKIKVLFVCIHNSARSQMAEAFLNELGGDRFEAMSAGIEPGTLNLNVVRVMEEVGIDISGNKTKDVFEFYRKGILFNYVVTVCDETAAERCPVFPGHAKRIHWGFPDPSALQGSDDEKLPEIREIRDAVKAKVENWIREIG
jgi:arsenate reductase (thioredoxin)